MSEPTEPLPPQQTEAVAATAAPPDEPIKPRKSQYILPFLLLAIFVLTLLPGPLFFVALLMPGPTKENKTIVVPRGSSVRDIAQLLDKNEIIVHPLIFRAASRIMANDQLKAGEYEIVPGQSAIDIADLLHSGKTVLRQVTVPEGLTAYEVSTLLRSTLALSGDLAAVPDEGSLLPETYNYTYNDSRLSLIERMQKDARVALQEAWEKRAENLPLKTPREALILASIVEKETGKLAEERPLVASVFLNRLRLNMPLQSDPTVIYALTDGAGSLGRKLTHSDMITPSPMNTYTNTGLPPRPICNPGRAALEAVLHPQPSDYLYFVANGTGGHAFAKSLAEHNQNVAKWISLSRP